LHPLKKLYTKVLCHSDGIERDSLDGRSLMTEISALIKEALRHKKV
jgi:hypothetical protein